MLRDRRLLLGSVTPTTFAHPPQERVKILPIKHWLWSIELSELIRPYGPRRGEGRQRKAYVWNGYMIIGPTIDQDAHLANGSPGPSSCPIGRPLG